MGFFCFGKKDSNQGMPIGASLDMLEKVCNQFPSLVLEWIRANPTKAQYVEGRADAVVAQRFKKWDGPYSLALCKGEANERIYTLFFCNLRQDIKSLHQMVITTGEAENLDKELDDCTCGQNGRMESRADGSLQGSCLDQYSVMQIDAFLSCQAVAMLDKELLDLPVYSVVKKDVDKAILYCNVATLYVFLVCREYSRTDFLLAMTEKYYPEKFAGVKDLQTFMCENYPHDVLEKMVEESGAGFEAMRALAVSNWLHLQLLGDHDPQDVQVGNVRFSKLLAALTIDDLCAKGIAEVLSQFTTAKELGEFCQYLRCKAIVELSK